MMKNKFLLAALSLPMFFTACSQDELAEVSNNATNANGGIKVTLNVTKESDATVDSRASYENGALSWTSTDKISMYWLGNSDLTANTALTGHSNAIFRTTTGASFTSESLVYQGANVVVFPANLSHYAANQIEISVPQNQVAETVNDLPYVSNQLNIQALDIEANTPGYNQNVYAPMKMAANVVTLKLDVKNTSALEKYGFNINSVILESTDKVFATKSNVVVNEDNVETEGVYKYIQNNKEVESEPTIESSVWTSPVEANKVSSLTSKAIEKKNGAYYVRFVVLPTDAEAVSNAKVIVNTTCGTITINSSEEEDFIWKESKKPVAEDTLSIAEAFEYFVSSITMPTDEAYDASNFQGEKVGRTLDRTIEVDASKAVLDGSYVYDSEDIIRYVDLYTDMKKASSTDNYMNLVMAVENAEEAATWKALTKAAVDAVNSKNDKTDNYVTLSADENTVNAIELTTAGAVYDVPAFENETELPLILGAGEWTMDDTFELTGSFSKLQNNGTLTVAGTVKKDGTQNILAATLENNGTLKVGGNNVLWINDKYTSTGISTFNVADGQKVIFKNDINTGSLKGTITVAADGKLLADEGAKVVTEATINNYGLVSTDGYDNGFYNKGTVNMLHAQAATYLQDNEGGVIELMNRDDEVQVKNQNGKIKYHYNVAEDGDEVVYGEYDRFNYLVFGNDATTIYLPEISDLSKVSMEFTAKTTLEPNKKSIDVLQVNKGAHLTIKSGREVTVTNVVLKGELTLGGTVWYTGNENDNVVETKPYTQGSGAILPKSGTDTTVGASGEAAE